MWKAIPPRSQILAGTVQVGYIEWSTTFGTKGGAAFDMKGNKLYDVDEQMNLVDPTTKKVVGHLADAGASPSCNLTAASELFPLPNQ